MKQNLKSESLNSKDISYYAIPGLKGMDALVHSKPNYIDSIVAQHFGESVNDIRNGGRTKNLSLSRQICMWLLRYNTGLSLKEIANRYGKDHTTAIHNIRVVNNFMHVDSTLREVVKLLENKVQCRQY